VPRPHANRRWGPRTVYYFAAQHRQISDRLGIARSRPVNAIMSSTLVQTACRSLDQLPRQTSSQLFVTIFKRNAHARPRSFAVYLPLQGVSPKLLPK
jgi:hypothetical protein